MNKQQAQLPPFVNEQDLNNRQLALNILDSEGPSLDLFNQACETQLIIFSLTCGQFITKIEGISNREVKFAGSGKEALLNSLSFILLLLACKQTKYYPHLLTLIKEQFFKPDIFSQYDPSKRNRVLGLCRNIEIQLISSGSVYEFLENNEDFLVGFQHILNKTVGVQEQESSEIIQIIRKKFNIDCGQFEICDSNAQCWILGMQKKIYLFEEFSYFIVVSINSSTDPARTLNQSTIQNRLQSQRSIEDLGQQIIVEASEQSTPKFKDNQESIRYRKKSHKNSFGGDFEITGYKQLVNLVNKNHVEASNSQEKSKNKKVFSLKFEIQEISNLQIDEPAKDQKFYNESANYNQEGINIAKNQVQMRGSHIQGNHGRFVADKKQRKDKVQRKRHITSSEIFQLTTGPLSRNDKMTSPKLQEENSNTNSNTASDYENKQGKRISNQNLQASEEGVSYQNLSPQHIAGNISNTKQNFKFSFSKKDSNKFIFKEIQSEYKKKNQIIKVDKQPVKLSLEQNQPQVGFFKSQESKNLLYEGDFKRKDKKRSLLIEASIVPIQEEVQSSQQEKTQEHSLPQSNQEREKEMLNLQDNISQVQSQQRSQTNEPNGNAGFNWNSGHLQELVEVKEKKGYLNIFKTKNRKFSYLTQPISISKNSLFGGNNELRQSYVEEGNETTPELQHQKNTHNPTNYIHNVHRQQNKNRSNRSPKIHKNSEAITESKHNKRRFEENPISFSQMIANVTVHEDSNFSGHSLKNNKRQTKAALCANVTEFMKNNVMCYDEPEGWVRKEVIYYFEEDKNNSFQNPFRLPERYVINRTAASENESLLQNSSYNKIMQGQISSENHRARRSINIQKINKEFENFEGFPKAGDLSNSPSWHNINSQNIAVERAIQSPNNNIRSTIDTSKNTHHKTQKYSGSAKSPYFKKQTAYEPPVVLNGAFFPPSEEQVRKQNQHQLQIRQKELAINGKIFSNPSPAATTRSYNNGLVLLKQVQSTPNHPRMNCVVNIISPTHADRLNSDFPAPFLRSASPVTYSMKSHSNEGDKIKPQTSDHFSSKIAAPIGLEQKQKNKAGFSPVIWKERNVNYMQEVGSKDVHPQNQTISYSPMRSYPNYENTKYDPRRPRQGMGEYLYYNKSVNEPSKNRNMPNAEMKSQQNNFKFHPPTTCTSPQPGKLPTSLYQADQMGPNNRTYLIPPQIGPAKFSSFPPNELAHLRAN